MTYSSNLTEEQATAIAKAVRKASISFFRRCGKDEAMLYHLTKTLPVRRKVKVRGTKHLNIFVHPVRRKG